MFILWRPKPETSVISQTNIESSPKIFEESLPSVYIICIFLACRVSRVKFHACLLPTFLRELKLDVHKWRLSRGADEIDRIGGLSFSKEVCLLLVAAGIPF